MPRNGAAVHRCLQQAALELFRERGYDQTTAAEIAARAGVTERTFFRHFADKREVLFGGSDDLRAVLVEKILQAPDVVEPLQVVTGVLAEFNWESLESRDFQRQRHAVIAANPELLERDLIKHRSIAVGFTDALRQRGVNADIAQLAARVGIQMFITAYEHWLEAGDKADLATISESVMSLLATIVPTSAMPPSSHQKRARVPANQAGLSPRRGRRWPAPER
jgi:AcrR family transcriptional regulator